MKNLFKYYCLLTPRLDNPNFMDPIKKCGSFKGLEERRALTKFVTFQQQNLYLLHYEDNNFSLINPFLSEEIRLSQINENNVVITVLDKRKKTVEIFICDTDLMDSVTIFNLYKSGKLDKEADKMRDSAIVLSNVKSN